MSAHTHGIEASVSRGHVRHNISRQGQWGRLPLRMVTFPSLKYKPFSKNSEEGGFYTLGRHE